MTELECQRAGFLADILAHPEDDTPRLVFADWLADNGEEDLGDFIRVQCELVGYKRNPHVSNDGKVLSPRWKEWAERHDYLRRRERDLLFDHWPEWCPRLEGLTIRCGDDNDFSACRNHDEEVFRFSFRRGFVAEVIAPLAALLEHLPALVRTHPIEEARVTDRRPANVALGPRLASMFGWFCRHSDHLPDSDDLPAPLWDLLESGKEKDGNWKGYASPEEAHSDLGAAILELARRPR
jgi:uncharacterized protein (TIGR02996 family)